MLFNYFKISLRNLRKNKISSAINITGLAVGMATCMLLFFWIEDELSYDRFHENADRIFRVERRWDFKEMHGQAPIAAAPWGPAIEKDYPEVLKSARINKEETFMYDYRNQSFRQKLIAADNSLFDIFNFYLSSGNTESALTRPFSIVLTRDQAYKYCGTEDALDKSITISWLGTPVDFKVTGILEKIPANSHMQFDIIVSFSSYQENQLGDWMAGGYYTFVLLEDGISPGQVEQKLAGFLKKYATTDFITYFGPDLDINDIFQIKLKPLTSIHLDPSRDFEFEPQGSRQLVMIFSIAAISILIIACFNFINLSTALSFKRAKEVALRKTVGATRKQLITHYFFDSSLVTAISFILAIFLIQSTLNYFNMTSGKNLNQLVLFDGINPWVFAFLALITAIMAGLYPAVYLSTFQPISVLRGIILRGHNQATFRKILTIAQFSISIILIIGTIIISRQLNYIQNKALGYDQENILIIPSQSMEVRNSIDVFRTSLQKDARILNVTGSSQVPGWSTPYDTNFKLDNSDDMHNLLIMSFDYYFMDTYQTGLVQGRSFDRAFGKDIGNNFMINERALQTLNLKPGEIAEKRLTMILDEHNSRKGEIIGIVRDFHMQSLHQKIQPMVYLLAGNEDINYLSVRITAGNPEEIIKFIRATWQEIYPNEQFSYTFLDQRLAALYASDHQTRMLFIIFTVIAVAVACLGLFGLATFTIRERTKEIGIRKVLGASVSSVVVLLSSEFSKWILLANLVAWPVAYFIMNSWLENFAFRTGLSWWVFLFSGAIALVIALFTVMIRAVKASVANPVHALKYE